MKISFTLTKDEINKAYKKVVEQAVKQTSLKGFRKGQAPKDLVIKEVGETKLQQQAIEEALPQAYIKAVNDNKAQPITYPEISLKSGKPGEDFVFEAEIVEKPEVKLGDYKKAISGLSASSKIWTPDKGDPKNDKGPSQEQQLDAILNELLKVVEVTVPDLLIDRETHRQMSRLVEQLEKMGLKVDDYLKSTNQTKDQLNEQYRKNSRDQLALEFILMEIASDLKVEIGAKEIDEFIASVGDDKVKAQLQSVDQRASVQVMLTKQAVIRELLKLA